VGSPPTRARSSDRAFLNLDLSPSVEGCTFSFVLSVDEEQATECAFRHAERVESTYRSSVSSPARARADPTGRISMRMCLTQSSVAEVFFSIWRPGERRSQGGGTTIPAHSPVSEFYPWARGVAPIALPLGMSSRKRCSNTTSFNRCHH